jgi:hypothetical protein
VAVETAKLGFFRNVKTAPGAPKPGTSVVVSRG